MKIYPLLLALLLAAMMLGGHLYAPDVLALPSALAYIGSLLLALGAAMVFASAGLFRRHNTTLNPHGEPTTLATHGLYRFSRNPMYLGMLLGLIGEALLLGEGALLTGPALFAWITTIQIRHEEEVMERQFGADYRAYRALVRRWL